MIKEDYCSYEVAKMLKDKGFPINEYSGIYTNKDNLCLTDVGMMSYLSKEDYIHFEDFFIPTITHQMAKKWLREVHNLQIQITPIISRHKDWTFEIYKEFNPLTIDLVCFPTYEEAVEVALKYCLANLL